MDLILEKKEICNTNKEHDHHFFCITCGKSICEECFGIQHKSKICDVKNLDFLKKIMEKEKENFIVMIKKTKMKLLFVMSFLDDLNLKSDKQEFKQYIELINKNIKTICACENLKPYSEIAKDTLESVEESENIIATIIKKVTEMSKEWETSKDVNILRKSAAYMKITNVSKIFYFRNKVFIFA